MGNPQSEAGLITLWTPAENIVRNLDRNLFRLAGQLYSKEGINYLLRNILSNPSIRYLVVCGQDLSGSGRALVNFFEKGVSQDYKILGSDFALIHKEIPREVLDVLRQGVKVKDLIGVNEASEIEKTLRAWQPLNAPFAPAQEFPVHQVCRETGFPSEEAVFKIRERHAGPAWVRMLNLIMKFGSLNKSWYGNSVKELYNIAVVVSDEDPDDIKMFPYFQFDRKEIEKYQQSMMVSDKGEEVYTYGERLFGYKGIDQVDEVIIPYLSKYPSNRAALAVTFDLSNDHKASRAPCLCLVQATTLGDRLNLTAYFRSHAIFSGWLLNVFGLRKVQKYIAQKLSLKLGTLTVFSNCAHIYDNELVTAEEIVKNFYPKEFQLVFDPRGYFVIKTEGKEIIASLHSSSNEFLEEFRQDGTEEKAASKLFQKLILSESVSEISHAFDLGAELQKAEIAIKRNLKYTQDKELFF